ncbi:MAG TPA: NAD(P)-binding domain-containing protein [Polyangiaceae bacterium]|jgi:putative flavoprotein involved in K+ transport|nr:NAD(P)-binding domain-containing protein [Polyangiaceae bacterium]
MNQILKSSHTRTEAELDVIVIGGGQSGLSVGYHLQRLGLKFAILDASLRVGDVWRKRWDTLRLFTPAWLDGLDGLPFPAPPQHFPSKEEMADYLELYARHFALPVRSGVRVTALRRDGDAFRVLTDQGEYRAAQVVIAMSNYQGRRVPRFAGELDPSIRQLHSLEYRRASQLLPGPVLIAGAGNSGAEIGVDLARAGHPVLLAGRDTGYVPFRIAGFWGRLCMARLFLRVLFHRVLTIRTPMGRKARPKIIGQGGPLIRQLPADLARAGIERAPRVVGVSEGRPRLADGRVLDVASVIWCTGFDSALDFIELPILDERGEPRHEGGVVHEAPGLYFVGQHFLYAFSSSMIHGVGRDAARIAGLVRERAAARTAPAPLRLSA